MIEIQSPCVRNCCLDNNDICLGCHRSLEEIMQWSQSDDKQKKIILTAVQNRLVQHK
ncbi:DUF1289 domain-containing protein [Pseudomonadota bacterium]|nr:DUF1289 domain-containing protein [Pseudomonadota bacterium]